MQDSPIQPARAQCETGDQDEMMIWMYCRDVHCVGYYQDRLSTIVVDYSLDYSLSD